MVYGGTYSFRVRSTFDFVTFSDWSDPLYGVVAPSTPTFYYINQGSGIWNDSANWFQDQAGTIPYNSIPTVSDNCEITEGNTVDEVPSSGYNSVVNYGTVTINGNAITTNNGTVGNNYGTVTTNSGTVTTNSGTVTTNSAVVTDNSGTVAMNTGTVTNNNGTVTYNYGYVGNNYSAVTYNCGTILNDQGSSGPCA
jgi:hypothetical protein